MLKVGIIGCGFIGTMHANCYMAIEDVEVAAVADIRQDKAKSMSFNSGEIKRLGQYAGHNTDDEDIYDTPTFLRKQAD